MTTLPSGEAGVVGAMAPRAGTLAEAGGVRGPLGRSKPPGMALGWAPGSRGASEGRAGAAVAGVAALDAAFGAGVSAARAAPTAASAATQAKTLRVDWGLKGCIASVA